MALFTSEADLCRAFLETVKDPWVAYAETAGWDILLVRKSDGFQIGIQAKLRLGADVIEQTLEDRWPRMVGPDCRAVLVPCIRSPFDKICSYIGITLIRTLRTYPCPYFAPQLPDEVGGRLCNDDWYETLPHKRYKLPDYVPDVIAGAKAPVRLTQWKISAIKVQILLSKQGFITRDDFKSLGVDHRRWTAKQAQWLTPAEKGFVPGRMLPDLRKRHPTVYRQIEADMKKWMPNHGSRQQAP